LEIIDHPAGDLRNRFSRVNPHLSNHQS